jgi:hypothetical protein
MRHYFMQINYALKWTNKRTIKLLLKVNSNLMHKGAVVGWLEMMTTSDYYGIPVVFVVVLLQSDFGLIPTG